MTQFALIKANNYCSSLKMLEDINDDFLLEIAAKLLPNASIDQIFVLDVDGRDIDSLMLDAQKSIIQSPIFEETVLYEEIYSITKVVDELVFWYGSDFNNLEYIYDVQTLFSKMKEAVYDSTCELYIHYKKTSAR